MKREMKMRINSNGGVELRIIIIGVTLIAIAIALGAFLKINSEQEKEYHRKAKKLSDTGFQKFMEASAGVMTTNPEAVESIKKTEYSDGFYEVKTAIKKRDDASYEISVVSIGTVNKVSKEILHKIVLTKKGDIGDELWIPELQ